MKTPSTIRVACLTALCILGALAANGAILDVDCTGGGFSLDIQTAVTAAGPGDTVVVHDCATPYDPFVVSGKDRVHVVAADIGVPANMGSQRVGVGTLPLTLFAPTVEVSGIPGTAACISIDSSFGVVIKGFYVTSCLVDGIDVLGSEQTTIVDNRIESVGGAGILDGGTFGTTITGNTVAFSAREGIFLEQSTLALVTDNLIGLNGADGIFIAGTDNHVVNNESRLNGGNGIHDVAASESRIERNTALANSGVANINIGAGSFFADVVGNETGASLSVTGTGAELFDNS